ncbi:MAG: hypothetical protein IPM95_03140 [Sphingobacteriales bacterium]|nr:hypothetical protein [Sphingobacteriales bacterium]
MRTRTVILFAAIILISSCARPYRRINMSSIPFINFREQNTISYSIRQGVMYNMRNYFFARREQKQDLSLIALKIVNKSELPINIRDLQYSCGATVPIAPVSMDEYNRAIKQKSGLYWLYSLGVVVYPKPPRESKKFIPLPFGIPVAAANFAIAYTANKKMEKDLRQLDLSNKVIQPGDSIQGVLPFKNVANCADIFISVRE